MSTSLSGIRLATLDDLNSLAALEEQSFEGDRISRSSYRRLLKRESALILVDDDGHQIRGSIVLLFRRGLAVARLYSIAVAPAFRGLGIGAHLVEVALQEVSRRGRMMLRLEVREDNPGAIHLYERLGFRYLTRTPGYYEDGATALRYEKAIVDRHEPPFSLPVPYYPQTLDFTCGAACLMMVLKYFRPEVELQRTLELDLWRESTTIFMTSGLGGCSAEGIAIAAIQRGLHARVVTDSTGVPFINSVRSETKKEVLRLVHASFLERLEANDHPVVYGRFTRRDIVRALDLGIVPILLVRGYHLFGEREPHWVVVTGYDDQFMYIHDPYVPEETPEFDGRHVPIDEHDFARMHGYGASRIGIFLSRAPLPSNEELFQG